MSEQPATYTPDTITPAVAAQRASDELSALHDLLAQAVGAASTLGREAEAALRDSFSEPEAFRANLALLLDDADAARVAAASRVDAELRKDGPR